MAKLMRMADVDVVKRLETMNDYELIAIARTVGRDVEGYDAFDMEDMDKLNTNMHMYGVNYLKFAELVLNGDFDPTDRYYVYADRLLSFSSTAEAADHVYMLGLDKLAAGVVAGNVDIDDVLNWFNGE